MQENLAPTSRTVLSRPGLLARKTTGEALEQSRRRRDVGAQPCIMSNLSRCARGGGGTDTETRETAHSGRGGMRSFYRATPHSEKKTPCNPLGQRSWVLQCGMWCLSIETSWCLLGTKQTTQSLPLPIRGGPDKHISKKRPRGKVPASLCAP